MIGAIFIFSYEEYLSFRIFIEDFSSNLLTSFIFTPEYLFVVTFLAFGETITYGSIADSFCKLSLWIAKPIIFIIFPKG